MAVARFARMRLLLDSSAAFALLLLLVPLGAEAQDAFGEKRRQMVESQIRGREIRNERVLQAMAKVPRHLFIPENVRAQACM